MSQGIWEKESKCSTPPRVSWAVVLWSIPFLKMKPCILTQLASSTVPDGHVSTTSYVIDSHLQSGPSSPLVGRNANRYPIVFQENKRKQGEIRACTCCRHSKWCLWPLEQEHTCTAPLHLHSLISWPPSPAHWTGLASECYFPWLVSLPFTESL